MTIKDLLDKTEEIFNNKFGSVDIVEEAARNNYRDITSNIKTFLRQEQIKAYEAGVEQGKKEATKHNNL